MVNGCNICCGDLMGLGMIFGLMEDLYGFMFELVWKGIKFLKMVDGSEWKFIFDNDMVIMCGFVEKGGVCVGFGEVFGKIFFVIWIVVFFFCWKVVL